jgi:hypothetical protein
LFNQNFLHVVVTDLTDLCWSIQNCCAGSCLCKGKKGNNVVVQKKTSSTFTLSLRFLR